MASSIMVSVVTEIRSWIMRPSVCNLESSLRASKGTVTLQTPDLDKYGRTLADVLLPDGAKVNQDLVKHGWSWWYRKYAL